MSDALQSRQSNGRKLTNGLRAMKGDVAKALEQRIEQTIFTLQAKHEARDAAVGVLKQMRFNTHGVISEAKDQVNALVLIIQAVHNGRYARISATVEKPDYDRIAFGCTLPETYKDDESVCLFASTVGATCVSAREKATALAKQEEAAAKAEAELETAFLDADDAQHQADQAIKRSTPPGSEARMAIKRSSPRKAKAAETVTVASSATSASPATAPVAAPVAAPAADHASKAV